LIAPTIEKKSGKHESEALVAGPEILFFAFEAFVPAGLGRHFPSNARYEGAHPSRAKRFSPSRKRAVGSDACRLNGWRHDDVNPVVPSFGIYFVGSRFEHYQFRKLANRVSH
jgi:hypothetical protein